MERFLLPVCLLHFMVVLNYYKLLGKVELVLIACCSLSLEILPGVVNTFCPLDCKLGLDFVKINPLTFCLK